MTGPSSPEPPCWSKPDPPSLSWTELVQPPVSEWAAYFPDIARFEPKALRFVPGTVGDIEGIYRGRQLKLSCSGNEMMITLSALPSHSAPLARDDLRLKQIVHFLTSGRGLRLQGEIEIEAKGQRVSYWHAGPGVSAGYAKCLFELLSDLADAYPTLVAMGSELIPVLLAEAIKNNWGLRALNTALLQGIAQATTASYRYQAARLVCPTCLVRCAALRLDLPWVQSDYIIYSQASGFCC